LWLFFEPRLEAKRKDNFYLEIGEAGSWARINTNFFSKMIESKMIFLGESRACTMCWLLHLHNPAKRKQLQKRK
jgi:hypothetical protein